MLLAGDEFVILRMGTTIPTGHDSTLTWTEWGKARQNRELTEFVKKAIAFRRQPSGAPSEGRAKLHRYDVLRLIRICLFTENGHGTEITITATATSAACYCGNMPEKKDFSI